MPSLNVTVPAGVPRPGELAVTMAVKVTDCPTTDGLAEEVTAVVVAVELTVKTWLLSEEPPKFPVPL